MSAPIYSPGYWNDPYRPHHPPHRPEDWCHPHHRIHSDIEPAFVVRPGEECCPDDQQNCECVTSGDVERWNAVWEMMSAFSGQNIDELASGYSAFGDIAASADLWNATYGIVSEYSANWNSACEGLAELEKRVTSAENDITDLYLTSSALSAELAKKSDKLYFDTEGDYSSIVGDGTKEHPYSVRNYDKLKNADVSELIKHFKPVKGTPIYYQLATDSAWSGYGPYPTTQDDPWISDGVADWILRISDRFNDKDDLDQKQDGQIHWNTSAIHELYNRLTGQGERIDETNERITDLQPAIASGVSAYAGVQALLQKDYVEFKFAGDRSIPACSGDGIIWVKED